jgi:hypothetical protein
MTFDSPDGVEFANICATTGKLAGNFCDSNEHTVYLNVPFAPGQRPRETCNGEIIPPLIAPLSGGEYASYAALSPITGFAHGRTSD